MPKAGSSSAMHSPTRGASSPTWSSTWRRSRAPLSWRWACITPASSPTPMRWTFGDGSFVPHDTVTGEGAPCEARVALTTGPLRDGGFFSPGPPVLINLSGTVPAFFEKFARVAEFLDARPEVRTGGRERFKTYRGKSIDPQTHNV